jgi:hypothetical protein
MSIILGTHHTNVRLTIRSTWVSDQMNKPSRSYSSDWPSFDASLTSLAGSRITPNSLAYAGHRHQGGHLEALRAGSSAMTYWAEGRGLGVFFFSTKLNPCE